MDSCQIPTEERDGFKKQIFGSIFYYKTWITEQLDNKAGKTFIEHFPNVYQVMRDMKGKKAGNLAIQIMQLESEIILQNVCVHCQPERG